VPHVVVVGAGIVGMAVAARLALTGHPVTVLEKENDLAQHQTGRNSGVIHAGLYYAPGSDKARLSVAGGRAMLAFAEEHGIPVEVCGKLVVATEKAEIPRLRALAERATANGVRARLVSPAEARDYEPNVACTAALRVEPTGIINYAEVCRALARQVRHAGGEILLGRAFLGARTIGERVLVSTSHGDLDAAALVVCGGLHADRLARASGLSPAARILPFRGEYYELGPQAAGLVRGLIYPVPDPRFPFLGVHLTRMIDGSVHAGPNAVLALSREGYGWRQVSGPDLLDALTGPELWRLGARNLVPGAREVARSLSRHLFARSLRRLVPDIADRDLVPSVPGVRAQAVRRDGRLVDDFLLQSAPRQVHVLNAPSPAATASLAIAATIVRALDEVAPGIERDASRIT
jgi:L-2-hydroxyglutarate oxidase